MALLSRHSNIFLQRTTLIIYSNLLAGPHDKRCRTRTSPPAGRFETSRGEVCRGSGTISAKASRPLAVHEASYFLAGAEMIVTVSLVSFTVVLRNVTQCFKMSPSPPTPPFSWGKCRGKTNERLQTRQLLLYQF